MTTDVGQAFQPNTFNGQFSTHWGNSLVSSAGSAARDLVGAELMAQVCRVQPL
jgi:hypothetical protein